MVSKKTSYTQRTNIKWCGERGGGSLKMQLVKQFWNSSLLGENGSGFFWIFFLIHTKNSMP